MKNTLTSKHVMLLQYYYYYNFYCVQSYGRQNTIKKLTVSLFCALVDRHTNKNIVNNNNEQNIIKNRTELSAERKCIKTKHRIACLVYDCNHNCIT